MSNAFLLSLDWMGLFIKETLLCTHGRFPCCMASVKGQELRGSGSRCKLRPCFNFSTSARESFMLVSYGVLTQLLELYSDNCMTENKYADKNASISMRGWMQYIKIKMQCSKPTSKMSLFLHMNLFLKANPRMYTF